KQSFQSLRQQPTSPRCSFDSALAKEGEGDAVTGSAQFGLDYFDQSRGQRLVERPRKHSYNARTPGCERPRSQVRHIAQAVGRGENPSPQARADEMGGAERT